MDFVKPIFLSFFENTRIPSNFLKIYILNWNDYVVSYFQQ